jgi:hypothetical protein
LRLVELPAVRAVAGEFRSGWHGPSSEPSISGHGRYVALHSAASTVVAGDSNGADDDNNHVVA